MLFRSTKISNPKLIALILGSLKVKTYLENEASGSTMSNLNLKILKNLPISLPPLEIQTQIVAEIEKRMVAADALEASLKSQVINAENLRQSILKRAFEGKLL